MNVKKIAIALVALIILLIPLIKYQMSHQASNQFTTFENLQGPLDKTIVPVEKPIAVSEFEKGSTSRMAVLITDEKSNWQDLIKGFKSIGIPIIATTDYKIAFTHKVVFIYPYVSGLVLKEDGMKALNEHPMNGGTVIAVNVLGGAQDTFGFESTRENDNHSEIKMAKTFNDMISPNTANIDPKETFIQLYKTKNKSAINNNSYQKPVMPALATYEDGSAAIVENNVGKGHAYAFSFDLGQLLYIGYSNREEDIARTYVNHYEPTIDLFLRFIKSIYQKNEDNAVTVNVVPEGKELALMWSHDVDYTYSVSNSLLYSQLEAENHVEATYFLQVKYIKDFNDKIFFDQKNIDEIDQVKKRGMEIGSHSISHSRQFAKFPLGNGEEKYPDYRPFVVDRLTTKDGSVLGELRVSKFLIEKRTAEKNVITFRPGELSNPYSLPQSLLATGFHFSSSVTANNSLTHMPFQLSYNREARSPLPIFEFPVTIEDEEYPNMINQIPDAIKVSEAIAKYGGIFVVLIHPNVPGHKLEFEKQMIAYWKERGWFGTIRQYGEWWAKRNDLDIDVNDGVISLTSKEKIKGLTLQLPNGKNYNRIVPGKVKFTVKNNLMTLGEFQGEIKISMGL
jgi:peptidoglycan/xylan/chitin deacetylase (PgdA/CDA1 family)